MIQLCPKGCGVNGIVGDVKSGLTHVLWRIAVLRGVMLIFHSQVTCIVWWYGTHKAF